MVESSGSAEQSIFQGSILGLLLFLVSTNDLPSLVNGI